MHVPRHLLILSLVLVLGGCTTRAPEVGNVDDPLGTVEVRRFQPIRVGVITTAGSGMEHESTELLRGAQLATEDYGRIHGFTVELVNISSECSPDGGRSSALALTEDPTISVVVGPVCASACEGAMPIFDEANVTVVSPSCGAGYLTDQVTHIAAFSRTIYGDRQEGETAARFAYYELGLRRAALIGDGTVETADLLAGFERTFASLGGTVVASETVEQGATSFRPVLTGIHDVDPQVIYAPLLPGDAVALSLQKTGAGLQDVTLIGGRHFLTSVYLDEAGYTAEGVYASGPFVPSGEFEQLAERYINEYDEPPIGAQLAFAYDATQLALRSIDSAAVAGLGGSLLVGKQALRNALYTTTTYPGITGMLTCSSWGDCSAGSLAVFQVRDSQWVETYIPD